MTDISTIVANPRTIDIKHPATGEPVGLKITLLHDSNPKVKNARREILNERLQRDVKATAARLEQNGMKLLIAAVSDWVWEGDLTFHGEKPAFSEPNLRKVIGELPWIRDQIEVELENDAAFFEDSVTA